MIHKTIDIHRGPDWKGGNADGLLGGSGEGTVTKVVIVVIASFFLHLTSESQAAGKAGMVSVKWDNGNYGYYRFSTSNRFPTTELKGWDLGTSTS